MADSSIEDRLQSQEVPHGRATVTGDTINEADPGFCNILGDTKESVEGRALSSLYTDSEGFEEFLGLLHSATSKQRPTVIATSWCRIDGKVAEIIVRVEPSTNCAPETWVLMATDTTIVHKQARLQERHENTLNAILDHSPIGFGLMVLDPSGNRVMGWYNPSMGDIFGYDNTALLGQSSRTLYGDDESFKRSGLFIKQQLEEKGICDFTPQMMKSDGTLIDVRVITVPVRLDNEISLLTIVEDITERNRAERELRESEERLNAIVKAAPLGIGIIQDRKIVWCNEGMVDLTGYSLNEIYGKSTRILYPDDESYEVNGSKVYKEIGEEGVGSTETEFRRKDGTTFTGIARLARIEPNRVDSPVVVALADISALKEAESEQVKLARQVHELQKMDAIGQLAGGIAHDFNNLLMGTLGYAEILSLSLKDNAELQKYADTIISVSRNAASLTQKLLRFARHSVQVFEPLDSNEIIHQSAQLLRQSVDRKITIKEVVDTSLPTIIGDSSALQSAVLNLALNARDAMPDGGTIVLRCDMASLTGEMCFLHSPPLEPGKYVRISVSDTGHGIPEEVGEKVFEPFFTTKDPGKGTGLGLSTVYATAREHQGQVSHRLNPEGGTIFELLIPSGRKNQPIRTGDTHPSSATYDGCVLIIDDESIVRDTTRVLLQQAGFEVITAADGQCGAELFAQKKATIDLVLLDVVMPKPDGRETYELLRNIDPEVKVILCTGFARDVRVTDLIAEGATGILNKPYGRQELLEKVASVIDRPAHEQEPKS